jgi:hypothetical protein
MKTLRIFAVLGVLAAASLATAAEPAPKSGSASGTFATGGKAAKLAFAATFTDQKDDKKALVLVLSDQEVPASKFKDGSDLSSFRREHKTMMGVAFWMDAKNEIFRTDFYDGTSFPTSATGLFDVKVTRAAGSLTGTAKSNAAAAKLHDPVSLDATFNAPVK